MTHSPFRRAVACVLVAQPVLWMNATAYAQSVEESMRGAPAAAAALPGGAAGPGGLADTEVVRGERSPAVPLRGTATPLDEAIDPERYVCGPGDVLDLNFWGAQNFRSTVTIDAEGRAFLPRLGYFALAGKTLAQARQLLKAQAAKYFPALSFDVTLAEPRTFLVQVVDAVGRPGTVPAKATERVANAIAKAGGFGPNASRRRIEVRRRSGAVVIADLLLFQQDGDVAHNPYLLDGDVVRVPFEELAVTVGGAVNRPGRYELIRTRDLAELVELAGGLAPTATRLLPITVVRRGTGDRPDLDRLDFPPDGGLPALALRSQDNVLVPEVVELQQAVTVIGAIAGATPSTSTTAPSGARGQVSGLVPAPDEASSTRRMPFVAGDTVRTLLERVGGVGPLADLAGSYILRKDRVIPVDLYQLIMVRDLRSDVPVELGDTLVIPFKRRNVMVEGAVFAPGTYPYNPAFGVDQYLSLAGGRDRNAQGLDKVRIVTPSGQIQEYRRDLRIEPGSALVVPERTFSRPEVVQILLGTAGLILSGVAVFVAVKR